MIPVEGSRGTLLSRLRQIYLRTGFRSGRAESTQRSLAGAAKDILGTGPRLGRLSTQSRDNIETLNVVPDMLHQIYEPLMGSPMKRSGLG